MTEIIHYEEVPDGFYEWQVGDELQRDLTRYHHGDSDLDDEEHNYVLGAITDPRLGAVVREEHWPYWDENVVTIYIPTDKDPHNPSQGYISRRRFFG